MGNVCTIDNVEEQVKIPSQYERLERLESVFLREINPGHSDYKTAQQILNERTLNQYGNMMRNAPNMGF